MQGASEQSRSKAVESMENGTHRGLDQASVSLSGHKPSNAGMLL